MGYSPKGGKESDTTEASEHAHTQGQDEPRFPDSQPIVLSSPAYGLSCQLQFLSFFSRNIDKKTGKMYNKG